MNRVFATLLAVLLTATYIPTVAAYGNINPQYYNNAGSYRNVPTYQFTSAKNLPDEEKYNVVRLSRYRHNQYDPRPGFSEGQHPYNRYNRTVRTSNSNKRRSNSIGYRGIREYEYSRARAVGRETHTFYRNDRDFVDGYPTVCRRDNAGYQFRQSLYYSKSFDCYLN